MGSLEQKIESLRERRTEAVAQAAAILEQSTITPVDRKIFDELVELAEEINQYAARVTAGGKDSWRIHA